MEIRRLKYFAVLSLVLGIMSLSSSLSARQDLSKDQSGVASTQVPQALKDFVQQSVKQGLSFEQIIEQAIAQGYTKEQIVAACSIVMEHEGEALSTQDIVVLSMLGTVVVATVGVGLWFAYKWLTSETGAGHEHGEPRFQAQEHGREGLLDQDEGRRRDREQRDGHEPRVIMRGFNIAPVNGLILPGDGNQRLNQFVEQGLAAGRAHNDIVQEVRQMFPDVAFLVEQVREVRGNGVQGQGVREDRYAAWNRDPLRDINFDDLMRNF